MWPQGYRRWWCNDTLGLAWSQDYTDDSCSETNAKGPATSYALNTCLDMSIIGAGPSEILCVGAASALGGVVVSVCLCALTLLAMLMDSWRS